MLVDFELGVLNTPGLVSRRSAIALMEEGDCCKEKNKVAEHKRQTAYFEVFSISNFLVSFCSKSQSTWEVFLL